MFQYFKQNTIKLFSIPSAQLIIFVLMFTYAVISPSFSAQAQRNDNSPTHSKKIIVDVLGWRLRAGLKSSLWSTQKNSAQELFKRNDLKGVLEAQNLLVWPRIQKLYVEDGEFPTYSAEYNELVELGSIIVEPLIENLFDETANTDSRKWSARLLGEVGGYEQVLDLLMIVINNAEDAFKPWHVTEAKTGLSILISRQSKAVSIIEDFLSIDHGYADNVRAAAAQGAAILKDPAAFDILIKGLADPYSPTRFWSAIALSNMGEDMAVGELLNALSVETNLTAYSSDREHLIR